jgi:hypothetical protein
MKAVALALTIAVTYLVASALTAQTSRVEGIVALAIVLGPAITVGVGRSTKPFWQAFAAVSAGVFLIEMTSFVFPVGQMRERMPDVMPGPAVVSFLLAVLACLSGSVGGTCACGVRFLRDRIRRR